MGVFSLVAETGHEQVLYGHDPKSGLRTIIAIHSTALGPALGGTRFYPYETEELALRDVLRHRLNSDTRVFLYGEDIEDPKGDVFGVTRGLSTEFPHRVQNSALSESTIVGSCIGQAMAGTPRL